MEIQLSLEFLRVVEKAAIASARTMGLGDRHKADEAAVKPCARRWTRWRWTARSSSAKASATKRPCCTSAKRSASRRMHVKTFFPAVDIAVDPLEGTNLCATGAPNAITVLAASEKGGLLHAPDLYMEKMVVGPSCKGAVDLDAPVAENLRAIAKRLDRDVEDLVIIVLDRPRHEKLINDIRATGARIRLIGDGDLSAGISAAVIGTGVHTVMGTGGAPEGVLTAAALRCLNGQILARLVVSKAEHHERIAQDGHQGPEAHLRHRRPRARQEDHLRVLRRDRRQFAPRRALLRRRHPHTLADPDLGERQVRFIDAVHLEKRPDVKVRFF